MGLRSEPAGDARLFADAANGGVAVDDLLDQPATQPHTLARPDLVGGASAGRPPSVSTTVICHGDLHPFNLLVDDNGDVTVVDWTAAIRAEPAYDVAFTAMLLANPPLDAPVPSSPLRPLGRAAGERWRGDSGAYVRASPPR